LGTKKGAPYQGPDWIAPLLNYEFLYETRRWASKAGYTSGVPVFSIYAYFLILE
jgi:hypothetical protein